MSNRTRPLLLPIYERNSFSSGEHYSDGDNLILFDKESDTLLYGHEILRQVLRRGQGQEVLIVHVAAEAYIALLETHFSRVPEVCIYLAESNRLDQINPGEGKLLEAVSNAIWLEKRHLDIWLTVTETSLLSGCREFNDELFPYW